MKRHVGGGRAVGLGALATAALVVGGLGACGGQADEESRVRDAVERLQQAFRDDDLADACAQLTSGAQRHLGQAGHGAPTSCEEDLGAFADMTATARQDADEGHRPSTAVPKLGEVVVDGDRATVMLAVGDAASRVPMVKDGDTWKVDALYGDMPGGAQEDKFR